MRRSVASLAAAVVLCGCTPAVPVDQEPLLHGSLLQFRRDAERRRVQVRLTAAREGIVVESVAVDVDGFTPSPEWQGPTALPEDRPLDLPVTLTSPVCTVEPTDLTARVTLSGRPDPVVVPLDDGGLLVLWLVRAGAPSDGHQAGRPADEPQEAAAAR